MFATKLNAESFSTLDHQDEYLKIKNAYGFDNVFSNKSLAFLNQSTIAYIVGCNLLTIDIETLKQKLLTFKCRGKIELIEIGSDRNHLLLVDIEYKNSTLTLIDLKDFQTRGKIYRTRLIENETIKSVSISRNKELVACLSNSPDSNLSLFSFNRLNLLAKIKIQTLDQIISVTSNINSNVVINKGIEQVTFLPNDNKRLIVIGNRFVKIFLFTKNSLKQIYSMECNFNLINFSWLNKNEIIAYDLHGNLIQIDPKQNSLHLIELRNFSLDDQNSDSMLSLTEKDKIDLVLYKKDKKDSLLTTNSLKTNAQVIKSVACNKKGIYSVVLNVCFKKVKLIRLE
jgi:hypothetical protein